MYTQCSELFFIFFFYTTLINAFTAYPSYPPDYITTVFHRKSSNACRFVISIRRTEQCAKCDGYIIKKKKKNDSRPPDDGIGSLNFAFSFPSFSLLVGPPARQCRRRRFYIYFLFPRSTVSLTLSLLLSLLLSRRFRRLCASETLSSSLYRPVLQKRKKKKRVSTRSNHLNFPGIYFCTRRAHSAGGTAVSTLFNHAVFISLNTTHPKIYVKMFNENTIFYTRYTGDTGNV